MKFFVESDFFVNSLMEIGETVTDEYGLAKIDYIPNQAGVLRVMARYEVGSGLNPVEIEREVNITGSSESFYQTRVGIQFPYRLLLWMILLVIVVVGVWGTFLYVLYQVLHISRGTGVKGVSLILMLVTAALVTMLVLVLITSPNTIFHFLP